MARFKYFAFTLIVLFQITNLFATDIMPLSEIKEGMTGVGRTVFKGNKIEEFEVEILGVLHNYLPQQNLILGILKGSDLEQTGVIAGMSGSPVFIDGKMIGAVAYSWPFAKTPIAGITPIESMLQTQVAPEQVPIAPPIEVANYFNFQNILQNHFPKPPSVDANVPELGSVQLRPIAAPLMASGFDQSLIRRFTPLFNSFGMHPMQGAAVTGQDSTITDESLEPGSPVFVQLIAGDFDMGALGTVTYRKEDKILAFGHPFFNLGPIDFPMATAKVFTVVPSLFSSFKLGASGAAIGSVKQDLHAAVFGIMGNKSPMIPIKVNLLNEDNTKREFRFSLVKHKLLSAVLLDFAFQNSILVTQLGFSESTLKVNGLIRVKNQSPIQISNIFSGTGSFTNASQYVASIVYTLMTNEFKDIEVEDVVIDVETSMKRKEAQLLEVWLDKNEVRPGESITVKAIYRPALGQKKQKEFQMVIPEEVRTGQIFFVVGSGQEISRQEYAQIGKAYQPDNLEQLITLLNGIRSNDRMYVKAFSNEPSLIMKGQFLYSLPQSVQSILSSSQTIGSSQKLARVGLWEDSQEIDYYLTGTKTFSVKVLPKQN